MEGNQILSMGDKKQSSREYNDPLSTVEVKMAELSLNSV
jgi:hypothetical protein